MLDEKMIKNFLNKIKEIKDKNDFLQEILIFLKNNTMSDSVGIRLKSNNDYPYYTTLGFTNYFVKMENFLCKRNKNQKVVIGPDGCPVFECMCGAIITGNIDQNLSCFTKFGSFVTNGATKFAENSKDILKNYNVRGRCVDLGYESIVLVPIPINKINVGLIQLNAFKKDTYGENIVQFVEEIASFMGIMLEKLDFLKQSEKETTKSMVKKNICKIINGMQTLTQKILKEEK